MSAAKGGTSKSGGLKERLSSITACPICLDDTEVPRSLPCLHTFCHKCVANYWKDKMPGDDCPCPVCRTVCLFPKNGVDGFPHNFFLEDLIDANRMSADGGKLAEAMCEVCSDMDPNSGIKATVFCSDCAQKLCDRCSMPHIKVRRGGAHHVVGLDAHFKPEMLAKQRGSYCETDPEEQVKLFCTECKVNVCMLCFALQHQQHKCIKIDIAAAEFQKQIDRDLGQIQDHVAAVKTAGDKLTSQKTSFIADIKKRQTGIQQKAAELKKAIDTHVNGLMGELEDVKVNAEKEIATCVDVVETAMTSLESYMSYAKEVRARGKSADITRVGSDLHKRALELCQMKLDGGIYRPPSLVFTPASLQNPLIGNLNVDEYSQEPALLQSLPSSDPICGVACLGDVLYVLLNRTSDQLVVYQQDSSTSEFTRQRSITIPNLRRQADMTASAKDKCLYVVDYVARSVHVVPVGDAAPAAISSWPVVDDPWGISITPSSNSAVIVCDEARKLKKFSTAGKCLEDIVLSVDLINPCHAVEMPFGDQYVVTHGFGGDSVRRVSLVGADGKVTRMYSGEQDGVGSNPGQSYGPRHLAVDEKGFVFVADNSGGRVLLLSPSLQLVREVVASGAGKGLSSSPWRLHLDCASKRLYVAENELKDNKWVSGKVAIFQL